MGRPVRRNGWFLAAIVLIGAAHRGLVFWDVRLDLDGLISVAPETLTWQYLTLPALTEHLWASLVYLQQTPPIPNVVLGLVAKAFGWPHATAYVLVAFQAALSIAAAVFLFRLLCTILPWTFASFILSLVFLLSTDLLVLEYNAFGQTFYEGLATVLLLANVAATLALCRSDRLSWAAASGLTAGALALTRAFYSYFFFVPAVFILLAGKSRLRSRPLLVFGAVIVFTQIAWCGKNLVVYGTRSIATTSWGGLNFAHGLSEAGYADVFRRSILEDPEGHPGWFTRMVRQRGLVFWDLPYFRPNLRPFLPVSVVEEEARIQAVLGGTNRPQNGIGLRLAADQYMKAYLRFLAKQPGLVLEKYRRSYVQFWQPIRNYSIQYVGPLFVEPQIENSFDLPDALRRTLTVNELRNQFIMQGRFQKVSHKPDRKRGRFLTLPYLPGLTLLVNVAVLHLVVPALLLFAAGCWWKWRRPVLSRSFLFLLSCYLYVAVVANLPEHGENMRFRLSVEPIIWLISASSLVIMATEVARYCSGRRQGVAGE